MRTLITLSLFMLSIDASAFQITKGKCYSAQPFGYYIVQKYSNKEYGMVSEMLIQNRRAVLKTQGLKPMGRVVTFIKHTGQKKKMVLSNGFDVMADVWEECQ